MPNFLFLSSEMANTIDPDQTTPSGTACFGSTLFTCGILSETLEYEILGHLQ